MTSSQLNRISLWISTKDSSWNWCKSECGSIFHYLERIGFTYINKFELTSQDHLNKDNYIDIMDKTFHQL